MQQPHIDDRQNGEFQQYRSRIWGKSMASRQRILAITILATLSSCSPKVDTSTPDAYRQSVKKVADGLSPADQTALQKALVVLSTDTTDPSTGLFSGAPIDSPIFLVAGDKIKGKSGKDIIAAGNAQLRENITKKLDQDAATLKRIKDERAKVGAVLDNLVVSEASYSARRDIIGQREPEIKFSFTNSSKLPIKSISLNGVLSSPGRSVPWVQAEMSYNLPGGAEPGETKHLDLAPNMFGPWSAKDEFADRKDLVLKLTVENAEGADGQDLLPAEASEIGNISAEMAKLQKQLGTIPN